MSLAKFSRFNLFGLFDLVYLIKFSLFFLLLYSFNYYYIGVVSPQNFYLPFCDKYLNYISWLRHSTLFSSNQIAHAFGLHSYVYDEMHLRVFHGTSLFVATPCLGISVMAFWTAFVLADDGVWKKKIIWWLGGLFAIWCINCFRVAFILLAFQKNWRTITHMDHHTAFNILSYALIFFLIFLYFKLTEPRIARIK